MPALSVLLTMSARVPGLAPAQLLPHGPWPGFDAIPHLPVPSLDTETDASNNSGRSAFKSVKLRRPVRSDTPKNTPASLPLGWRPAATSPMTQAANEAGLTLAPTTDNAGRATGRCGTAATTSGTATGGTLGPGLPVMAASVVFKAGTGCEGFCTAVGAVVGALRTGSLAPEVVTGTRGCATGRAGFIGAGRWAGTCSMDAISRA